MFTAILLLPQSLHFASHDYEYQILLHCLVFDDQQTLSKDEAPTSPDSELVIGHFPYVVFDGTFSIAA